MKKAKFMRAFWPNLVGVCGCEGKITTPRANNILIFRSHGLKATPYLAKQGIAA
jgi:hypothetical protein